MDRDSALKLLEKFIFTELKAKLSAGSFYQIDGGRICTKCRDSKRRTLYMIIAPNMPVMLKCFRATCLMQHIIDNPDLDPIKARPITREELIGLGFNNHEAIESILNCKDFIYKKTRKLLDRNILVNDTMLSQRQIDYISKRCRFKPTMMEVDKYHIIPNVCGVIEDNDVELDETMSFIYSKFNNSNSLTFLCGSTTLSTRAITDEVKMQKSILNIVPNMTSTGYMIGDNISNNRVLIISEGIFDIINAERYFANFGGDKKDILYVATLGFAKTLNIIEYYFYKNIDTIEDLIIFMDSDVKVDFGDLGSKYTYIEEQVYNLIKNLDLSLGVSAFKNISLCYNTKGKDCGDLSSAISMCRVDINKGALYAKYHKKEKRR